MMDEFSKIMMKWLEALKCDGHCDSDCDDCDDEYCDNDGGCSTGGCCGGGCNKDAEYEKDSKSRKRTCRDN